jgi:CheY-like chemotaxis protein
MYSILLVEDNPDEEALALRAFKDAKLKNAIFVVRDGVEAIDYLMARGKFEGRDVNQLPRVVFLDLKLPKIDGLEVLKSIRENEHTKHLPVVVLTSSKEDKDLVSAYESGCNSYIVKPMETKQFADTISALEYYWFSLNERVPQKKV